MDYSGYSYQQQQQQQHSYGYDPSQIQIQIQPYDQSYGYQQFYGYNPQYAYYPTPTAQPSPVHPPGVSPTAPPIGQSQYRGRGSRGGRPFRGASRGRGHGRGHGVGGGRFISHSSGHAISNAPGASVAAGATSVVEPSSSVSAHTQLSKPARGQPPVAPLKVGCEICKVECNTPEILEQHKNGKKHHKNMRLHEELQRRNAMNGQHRGQIPTSQLNITDQSNKVKESEENGCPTENMSSGVIFDNHKEEIQLQNNVGNISEVPAELPEGKTMDNSAAIGRGLKRKKKGGKGGKYMKTNDGSKLVEPGQTVTFKCQLCDVKCESHVVYQSHLTGKKHLSKLRRAQNQASSGVALSGGFLGLQAIYPPDINALSNSINAQVQQGDNDPQLLLAQLLMTVLSQAQAPATAPETGTMASQLPAISSMARPSYEPQLWQSQLSDMVTNVMEKPSGETKTEVLPVPLESNAQPGSSVGTRIEGGGSETKQQV